MWSLPLPMQTTNHEWRDHYCPLEENSWKSPPLKVAMRHHIRVSNQGNAGVVGIFRGFIWWHWHIVMGSIDPPKEIQRMSMLLLGQMVYETRLFKGLCNLHVSCTLVLSRASTCGFNWSRRGSKFVERNTRTLGESLGPMPKGPRMTSFSFAFQSARAFDRGQLARDKTALEFEDSYGSSSSQKQRFLLGPQTTVHSWKFIWGNIDIRVDKCLWRCNPFLYPFFVRTTQNQNSPVSEPSTRKKFPCPGNCEVALIVTYNTTSKDSD